MEIKSAIFIKSAERLDQCLEGDMPEVAFIGRSNVGKSSLINFLVNRKGLAKTSQSPGKTITINYFLINGNWHLVDVPGYGYAKVAQATRARWMKSLDEYLEKREQLACVFVLVDISISPQKIDIERINWLGEKAVPLAIIFTKADKEKKQKVINNTEEFKKELKKVWEELPMMFISSSEKREGEDQIKDYIEYSNANWKLNWEQVQKIKAENILNDLKNSNLSDLDE